MSIGLAMPKARGFEPGSIFVWRVQDVAYQNLAWGPEQRSDLTSQLYRQQKAVYLLRMNNLAEQAGYKGAEARLTDRATINRILGRARADANSILATHNRDLAYGLRRVTQGWVDEHGSLKGLNRTILAARMREWAEGRNRWKMYQVGMDQIQKANQRALEDFIQNNGLDATTHAEPETAVCDDCRDVVGWGEVPMARAYDAPFPFHVNCVHYWVIQFTPGQEMPEKPWMGGSWCVGDEGKAPVVLEMRVKAGLWELQKDCETPLDRLGYLNDKYGEYTEDRVQGLIDEANEEASFLLDPQIRRHLGGVEWGSEEEYRSWQALDAETIKGLFIHADKCEQLIGAIGKVDEITEWALRNEFAGRDTLTLFHGSDTEKPGWFDNVRVNTSFSDNPYAASSFGLYVHQVEVPIENVRLAYRYTSAMQRSTFVREQEFIVKGGSVEHRQTYGSSYAELDVLHARGVVRVLPGTYDWAKQINSSYVPSGVW